MPCSHHRSSPAALVAILALGCGAIGCGQNKPQSGPSPIEVEPPMATGALLESTKTASATEPAIAQANAAAKPATTPPGKTGDPCPEICERTVKLGCGPRGACMSACAQANDGSICGAEMSAFMGCALGHAEDRWECSESGVAAIRDGYCETEQLRFMRCFESAAATN